MPDPTTAQPPVDALVHQLADHLAQVVPTLLAGLARSTPSVQQLEEQVLPVIKELGGRLLAGLIQQLVPADPPSTHPCPCGATAQLQRLRPATCRTVLGTLSVTRPYYLCATCHHGGAPFDQQVGWCAGSRSAGLDELLALLGVTQDSFVEAARVLDRLTLVQVAPNTVRTATEQVGAVLVAHDAAHVLAVQADGACPAPIPPSSAPLCVSLDGVQVHLTPAGWKEVCVGAVYQVHPGRGRCDRRTDAVHAEAVTYVAELGSQREAFGWQLYTEAQRRGAATRAVVVIGDGAAWVWTLAEVHFPHATQVLDWFHATAYVWNAATTIWGTRETERTAWAEQQLAALWAGQVGVVLTELQRYQATGEAVGSAHTYFTNQQARMDYPAYRARGLPIGSGTIESGCKQVVTSRLKGTGMIWGVAGAQQVVKVRAWLRGGRWQAAMALRPLPQRHPRRLAHAAPGQVAPPAAAHKRPAGAAAPSTVADRPAQLERVATAIAQVRAERTANREVHPWRAWSRRQQRAADERPRQPARVSSG